MKTKINDSSAGRLSGRLRIYEGDERRLVVEDHNEITDASAEIIRGLLGRDPENYMLETIAVGKGGDCEVDPPHNDTGARVAPDAGETEIRSLVEAIPIQATKFSGNQVIHTAIVRQEQAISNDINEFALLTRSGLMYAHFVTAAGMGGRATKKPKTDVIWIIEWTLEYDNA